MGQRGKGAEGADKEVWEEKEERFLAHPPMPILRSPMPHAQCPISNDKK
ncbi:histidine kinase [Nostoc linckia]|nr:histidine kinase [Nostoc linckia]